MPEPSVNLFQTLKNAWHTFRGTKTAARQQPAREKTWVEKEYDKKAAQEKQENDLLAKRKRVYSRWNQFKDIFGMGETLTRNEAEKLVEIDARKHFRATLDDKSVWDIE